MEWKNFKGLTDQIGALPDDERAKALVTYALSTITKRAVRRTNYVAPDDIAELLPLSVYGKALIDCYCPGISAESSAIVAFLSFYHRAPLLDFEKIDLTNVLTLVQSNLEEGAIVLPDRFGRELYDRYNSRFSGQRLDFLPCGDADALAEDTKQEFTKLVQ